MVEFLGTTIDTSVLIFGGVAVGLAFLLLLLVMVMGKGESAP